MDGARRRPRIAPPWHRRAAPRRALVALAAFLAAALPTATAPRAAATMTTAESPPASLTSPVLSGLPWRSGVGKGDTAFAAWRGRPLDVSVLYLQHGTWDEIARRLATPFFRTNVAASPQPVVSLAMMPRNAPRQFAACAQGAFDGYYRQYGALLAQAGAGAAVVRLGWEANSTVASHPWSIANTAQIPDYVACFRREAAALRSTAPGVRIEWTNAKQGALDVSVLQAYPGDDVVDLWGVHYYDTGPQKTTQAVWDATFWQTSRYGAPWGLGAWLAAAQSRGKRLAVPEWGVWDGKGNTAPDNPLYVENMYRTFRTYAALIEYESYFNSIPAEHQLYPVLRFPASSASYRQLWLAGQ